MNTQSARSHLTNKCQVWPHSAAGRIRRKQLHHKGHTKVWPAAEHRLSNQPTGGRKVFFCPPFRLSCSSSLLSLFPLLLRINKAPNVPSSSSCDSCVCMCVCECVFETPAERPCLTTTNTTLLLLLAILHLPWPINP